jgi:formylglycine-generating enzyme required for sulfatase activity
MGSQKEDPSGPNYDPDCSPALESPVVLDVEVPAFFLSKYEMTRGQWTRFVEGRNTKFIPMSMVTWNQCDTTTRRLGLMLPSEVQWEYAARGGTIDAWWKGAESNGGHIPANLLDLSTLEFVPRWEQRTDYVDWDDGFRRIAPPGTFAPNPLGLHNLLGNVSEWTSSYPGPLGEDGGPPRGSPRYVSRGGNLLSGPSTARPSFRGFSNVAEFAIPALGLRPARAVDAPR